MFKVLTPAMKRVYRLWRAGYTRREIARRLRAKPNTVKVTLSRAKKQLSTHGHPVPTRPLAAQVVRRADFSSLRSPVMRLDAA